MITNPAIDVLRRELAETALQIDEMSEALRSARAKQKSIEAALEVLTGESVAPTTADGGATLKDQIIGCLSVDGMGHGPADIANLLTGNGRETSNQSVSSTLSRMKNEGLVVKRNGKWFLPQVAVSENESILDNSIKMDEPPEGGPIIGEAATSSNMQPEKTREIPSVSSPDLAGQTRHWKMPGT